MFKITFSYFMYEKENQKLGIKLCGQQGLL